MRKSARLVAVAAVLVVFVFVAALPVLAAGGLPLYYFTGEGDVPTGPPNQGASPALGDNAPEPASLFDAWWAKLFGLWLLVPVAAFVRRLFTGWLNFLGVDEERYAGLAAAGAGGLIGLGQAMGAVAGSAMSVLGWGIGLHRLSRVFPPGGDGGIGAAARGMATVAGTAAGAAAVTAANAAGSAGGTAGQGAGFAAGSVATGDTGAADVSSGPVGLAGGAQGVAGPESGVVLGEGSSDGVFPPDDVKGDGMPEYGEVIEKRQAAAEMRRQMSERIRHSQARTTWMKDWSDWWGGLAGRTGALVHGMGMLAGTMVGSGIGGGPKTAHYVGQMMGQFSSFVFPGVAAYFQSPPPRCNAGLDGERWRA